MACCDNKLRQEWDGDGWHRSSVTLPVRSLRVLTRHEEVRGGGIMFYRRRYIFEYI